MAVAVFGRSVGALNDIDRFAGDFRTSASAVIGAIMRPRSVAIVGMSAKPGSAGRIVLELFAQQQIRRAQFIWSAAAAAISTATRCSAASTNFRSVWTLPIFDSARGRGARGGGRLHKAQGESGNRIRFRLCRGRAATAWPSRSSIGQIARAGGLALVGPNCLGLMNYVDGFAAVFFSPKAIPRLPEGSPRRGCDRRAERRARQPFGRRDWRPAAFRYRAGYRPATRLGLGLADFIQYLLDDPVTQVIVALRRRHQAAAGVSLTIAAEALRRGKPIVMMHPGPRRQRERGGALAYRGAQPAITRSCARVVEHAGVVVVDTLDELARRAAKFLRAFPKPSKGDLGNPHLFRGVLRHRATIFATTLACDVPPLSQETKDYPDAAVAGVPAAEESARSRHPNDLAAGTVGDVRRSAVARSRSRRRLRSRFRATSPRHSGALRRGHRGRDRNRESKPVSTRHPGRRLAAGAGIHGSRPQE